MKNWYITNLNASSLSVISFAVTDLYLQQMIIKVNKK